MPSKRVALRRLRSGKVRERRIRAYSVLLTLDDDQLAWE